jgi:short-chain fatty acids transporter
VSNPIARLGFRARRGFGRIVPDPFAIAVLLASIVMIAAVSIGNDPLDVIRDWSGDKGLWALLVFTMQMCLMLVLGTALASAPAVHRTLAAIARVAKTPRQLVGLTAAVAIGLSLLNWSLGLVGGALIAREAGRVARERNLTLHYPLLCAAGYAGLMTWHGGLSGSAPLKATTHDDLAEVLGHELATRIGPIPLEDTLFGTLNLVVTGGLFVLGPLLFMAMCPDEDPEAEAAPDLVDEVAPAEAVPTTAVERFESSPLIVFALAIPMAAGLGLWLADNGIGSLSFNTVNLTLFLAALVLHGRPQRFLAACDEGGRACTGVLLQFPLYAGIMGVMATSGLSAALSRAFADVGPHAFTAITFLSAGLLNLFVPSGGGQWAVQGPIIMEGAATLGVAPGDVVMAMAYGDQWTNMVQPFWALPLLALTGVKARDIIGYASIWMAAGGVWILSTILVFAG